jgi:hypothetical protein
LAKVVTRSIPQVVLALAVLAPVTTPPDADDDEGASLLRRMWLAYLSTCACCLSTAVCSKEQYLPEGDADELMKDPDWKTVMSRRMEAKNKIVKSAFDVRVLRPVHLMRPALDRRLRPGVSVMQVLDAFVPTYLLTISSRLDHDQVSQGGRGWC